MKRWAGLLLVLVAAAVVALVIVAPCGRTNCASARIG
jgi:hypothetical protein